MLIGQWESIGSGINNQGREFFSISVIDKDNIWAVPLRTNNTANFEYTRTVDGGMTWIPGILPGNIGNYYPGNIFALDKNNVWIILINIPQQDRIKIFNTSDGGVSWKEQNGEFNEVGHASPAIHFFNENEGIAFGSPGTHDPKIDSLQIFRTVNGGEQWDRIAAKELPAPRNGEGVYIYSGNNSYEVKGDTIWFVTRASRVFRSIDKGISWEAFDVGISGDLDYPGLSSIAFENSLNGIAVSFYPSRAAKTTDGGQTWTQINIPSSPDLAAIEYIPGTKNTYLVNDGFETSSTMLLTKDGGDSWEKLNFTPTITCMQFISPTIGFAGSLVNVSNNRGIYKWKGDFSDGTSSTFDHSTLNEFITLYPNPTNGASTLQINTPISSDILYAIMDIHGKIVSKDIVLDSLESTYIVLSNPLHAGIYFIDIVINGTRHIKKWVVIE